MAICFELVLNFGDDVEAAHAAAHIETMPRVLDAGVHRIPVHRPVLTSSSSRTELSILPVAVGWGVGLDGSLPRFHLTAAELTELGHHLYELLAQLDGYLTAKVGWDVESLLDTAELRAEWSRELADGSLDGLVVSDRLRGELQLGDGYVPFRPGYSWVPYRGEVPSSLTADGGVGQR